MHGLQFWIRRLYIEQGFPSYPRHKTCKFGSSFQREGARELQNDQAMV